MRSTFRALLPACLIGTATGVTYVTGVWTQPVTAADGHVWYLQASSVLYGDWATMNHIGAWDATDELGGTNPVPYPLDPSGETEIPATASPSRFFRLKAAEKQ